MMHLALALALLQPSDAARKAQADFAQMEKDVKKAQEALAAKMPDYQKAYQEAKAAGDDAKCAEIKKKAEDENKAIVKVVTDFIAAVGPAVKANPKDADLLEVRIKAHQMAGDGPGFLGDVAAVADLKPDDATAQTRAAMANFQSNRFEAALPYFERIAAKEPADAVRRGLCEFNCHKFDEAVKHLAAVDRAKLDDRMTQTLAQMDEPLKAYPDLWKKEQEIRAAEAKADDLPRVKLTTSRGEIELELFENEAPNTVANFITLVESKFFDGIVFHRVIANFMVQGGDPNSKDDDPRNDGTGGPGYKVKDELPEARYRRHFRGTFSMANSGPDTNGSQFFITHVPTSWLNGKHTAFGRVLKGQEVVDLIQKGDTILKAEILRKRAHEYKPTKMPGK